MKQKSKGWIKWLVVLLALLALAGSGFKIYKGRMEQKAALEAAAKKPALASVELASTDVLRPQMRELVQGLQISGSIKAVKSAAVKARVAGELQGLTVREGDFVQAGQVLAKVDSTEYAARVRQAQEQADSANTQIDIAKRQYDNNKALVNQGFISTTALDTSQKNLSAADANYRAALAARDVARKSLDDTVVKAPISGQISLRSAQPGERVGVDARLVDIVDLTRLELEASLNAADAASVRVGQVAKLTLDGMAKPINAHVVRINPSTQTGSRNVLVYLGIDNPAGLRNGMFAQGNLGTSKVQSLSVPLSSVRTDKPIPYVQLVREGKLAQQPVTLGVRGEADANGEVWVAANGINESMMIVAGNVGALAEGTVVKFTRPNAPTTPVAQPTATPSPHAAPAPAPAPAPATKP